MRSNTQLPQRTGEHITSPYTYIELFDQIIARGNLVVAGSWYRAGVGNVDPGGPLFCKV